MRLIILPIASEDLLNGYHFYHQQKQDLGDYFLDSLFADIDSLVVCSGIHPIFFKYYHRLLSKRFPFSVYYKIEKNTIIIYAVLDCRKNPAWVKDRLK